MVSFLSLICVKSKQTNKQNKTKNKQTKKKILEMSFHVCKLIKIVGKDIGRKGVKGEDAR